MDPRVEPPARSETSTSARGCHIDGLHITDLSIHLDERGYFYEGFNAQALERATSYHLKVAQINLSLSRRDVLRGIHAVAGTPGQAKLIQCLTGTILDVIVDLRPNSPTFGQHVSLTLTNEPQRSIFIEEGLGHAYLVLSNEALVLYATSSPYDPAVEIVVDALDPDLDLPWPRGVVPVRSGRDQRAQSFATFVEQSLRLG